MSISPGGEFLATSHAGDIGIYLWTNASLYGPVNLRPIKDTEEPPDMVLPLTSCHMALDTRGHEVSDKPESG